MLAHMRTTLNLDDELMLALKRRSAETGETMTSLIEGAVRHILLEVREAPAEYPFEWEPVVGHAQPAVDINDRQALYDFLDEPS